MSKCKPLPADNDNVIRLSDYRDPPPPPDRLTSDALVVAEALFQIFRVLGLTIEPQP